MAGQASRADADPSAFVVALSGTPIAGHEDISTGKDDVLAVSLHDVAARRREVLVCDPTRRGRTEVGDHDSIAGVLRDRVAFQYGSRLIQEIHAIQLIAGNQAVS